MGLKSGGFWNSLPCGGQVRGHWKSDRAVPRSKRFEAHGATVANTLCNSCQNRNANPSIRTSITSTIIKLQGTHAGRDLFPVQKYHSADGGGRTDKSTVAVPRVPVIRIQYIARPGTDSGSTGSGQHSMSPHLIVKSTCLSDQMPD